MNGVQNGEKIMELSGMTAIVAFLYSFSVKLAKRYVIGVIGVIYLFFYLFFSFLIFQNKSLIRLGGCVALID